MMEQTTHNIIDSIIIDGIVIKGIDPDIEIVRETNNKVKNLEQELIDINELLSDFNYQFSYNAPILDQIEEMIETTDTNIETSTDILEVTQPELYSSTENKKLKIIGGAGTGGLVLGGVGLCFGVVPAVIGLGIGMGIGAGITSGIYYLKDKLIN